MRSAFPIDAAGRNRSRNMSANLTPAATTKSPVAAAEQGLAGALWPRVPMPRNRSWVPRCGTTPAVKGLTSFGAAL